MRPTLCIPAPQSARSTSSGMKALELIFWDNEGREYCKEKINKRTMIQSRCTSSRLIFYGQQDHLVDVFRTIQTFDCPWLGSRQGEIVSPNNKL